MALVLVADESKRRSALRSSRQISLEGRSAGIRAMVFEMIVAV